MAGDFPSASEADWRKLVDAALKGGSFEQLKSRTYDGLTVEPLYSPARAANSVPGRGAAWTVMQRVDHPDPAAASAQAHEDLEGGATGLVLVFAGSVSANGFGLEANPAALARVLDGIELGRLVVDLNLSPPTRHMARELAALTKARGAEQARLDLRFSLNPIGGFAASGRSQHAWDKLAASLAATIGQLAGDGGVVGGVLDRSANRQLGLVDAQGLVTAGGPDVVAVGRHAGQRGRLFARARAKRHGPAGGL